MEYFAGEYDVAVIGAGHAGVEAALAAARLGCRTAVFTVNLDWVGNMACNPSIGGTSKGHLVREIDALGGEMGKAADANTLQSRMLNLGKGPAVHSLRAQIDRRTYSAYMKNVLETQDKLALRQAEIVSLAQSADGGWRLTTRLDAVFHTKTVILATGTFLAGRVYIGDVAYDSGPDGMFPAMQLAQSLRALGLPLRRFKTGTPPRVNRRSIDYRNLEEQPQDERTVPFSYDCTHEIKNSESCHITYTNAETKRVITENLHRSPLYSGKIDGVGPRYCPSIEDKIVRFAEKERHQLFLEPCGAQTQEIYIQGLSSSLPEEVQLKIVHSIPGLENAQIMRCAYAIEYDCIDPLALKSTLEVQNLPGLFGAGQFNGSSGYEEAAAQGLVAGVNAARLVQGKPAFTLNRAGSYIGTLIDDLITKGCSDPYRMMTSRSEYRLLLRQDNADRRLTQQGCEIGLIDEARYGRFLAKLDAIEAERKRVERTVISPSPELNALLTDLGTAPLTKGAHLLDLLKRPQLNYAALAPFDSSRPAALSPDVAEQVEIDVKYEGYLKRQLAQVAEMRRLEQQTLPEIADYSAISGLRLEAMEKLNTVRPETIGQASRVSGVSPADISVLLIHLERLRRSAQGDI